MLHHLISTISESFLSLSFLLCLASPSQLNSELSIKHQQPTGRPSDHLSIAGQRQVNQCCTPCTQLHVTPKFDFMFPFLFSPVSVHLCHSILVPTTLDQCIYKQTPASRRQAICAPHSWLSHTCLHSFGTCGSVSLPVVAHLSEHGRVSLRSRVWVKGGSAAARARHTACVSSWRR